MSDELLMLMDGNNLVIRAHFASQKRSKSGAVEALTTSDGRESGALFFSVKTLLNYHSQFSPDATLWCFDHGKSSFRSQIRSEYKANRGIREFDLAPQFDAFDYFLSLIGIRHYREQNVEADDLIATAVKRWSNEMITVIITGDHDLRQLVRDNQVMVCKPSIGSSFSSQEMFFDQRTVMEKYGIEPWRLPEVWSLQGDTGDNIRGVPKIGPKTALKIIQEYGDFQTALTKCPKLEGWERWVYDNYRMINLDGSVASLSVDLDECRWTPKEVDEDGLVAWLRDWEFNSLVKEYEKGGISGLFRSSVTI